MTPILEALDAVANILASNEPNFCLKDGRFYLKFLGLNTHYEDSDGAWSVIRDRIDTIFGPNFLNWDIIFADEKNVKPMQSSRLTRASQKCFSSLFEKYDFSTEAVKFYAMVAILNLYISSVHDQKEEIYESLCAKLSAFHQNKIQQIFEYILINRKTMTKENLSDLLQVPSSNLSTSGYSTPIRSSGLPSMSSHTGQN